MTCQPILAVISIIIAIIYNYNAIIQLSKITFTCSTHPIYSLQAVCVCIVGLGRIKIFGTTHL